MTIQQEWLDIFEKSKTKLFVMNEALQQQEIIEAENHFGRPVLGKILVLPRSAAEKFYYNKPWACISISESYGNVPLPEIKEENRVDLLRLSFDDIEFPRPRMLMMSEEQAQETIDFAERIWNEVDLLMIHCAAGISRSTAIAKAISEKYQPNFANYFAQLYSPNNLVYKLLKESYEKQDRKI